MMNYYSHKCISCYEDQLLYSDKYLQGDVRTQEGIPAHYVYVREVYIFCYYDIHTQAGIARLTWNYTD